MFEKICKHNYEYVGFKEVIKEETGERTPLRHYRCRKCKDEQWINEKFDYIRANQNNKI